MNVLLILILASLVVAAAFLAGFIWAVRTGQYDDTCTPALRMLTDDGTHGGGPPDVPAQPTPTPTHER